MIYGLFLSLAKRYKVFVDYEVDQSTTGYNAINWLSSSPKPTESEMNAWVIADNEEAALSEVRLQRDRLLAETDWWALSDVGSTPKRLAYRQALRDITDDPSNWSVNANGDVTVTFPTKPA